VEQLVARHGIPGESVDRVQRGGGVARAAAQPGAHGDPLGELDSHAEAVARGVEHGPRRPHGQILLHRTEVGTIHLQGNAGCCAPHDQLVGKLEQRKRRFDLMKA